MSESRIDASTRTPPRRRRPNRGWLAMAIGGTVVVAAIAANPPSTHASSSSRATGTTRARPPHPAPRSPTASAPLTPDAGNQPPANPDPLSPGLVVPSGQNQSDPFLFQSQGRYFLYTSGEPGLIPINVPVASAATFDDWGPVTDALPALPPWAVPGFTWAPDIHQFGSAYVLYFTALVRGSSPPIQCIGAATGSSPDGTFTPMTNPFICQADQGGTIDPRVFTDSTGTNWMLFKSDQNIGGADTPTKMWSQPLTADGLGLTGQPSELMVPDERWQGTIVEAPDMVEVDGTYWVFYSGNWYNHPEYAIGAARCAGPAGPCADTSPSPLLGTNLQGDGPGEASVFKGPTGVWLLYSPRRSLAPKPDIPPRPVDITRLGLAPGGPYLAAGGPPPSLEALRPVTLWSGP
jgi:hypothetical protein